MFNHFLTKSLGLGVRYFVFRFEEMKHKLPDLSVNT